MFEPNGTISREDESAGLQAVTLGFWNQWSFEFSTGQPRSYIENAHSKGEPPESAKISTNSVEFSTEDTTDVRE